MLINGIVSDRVFYLMHKNTLKIPTRIRLPAVVRSFAIALVLVLSVTCLRAFQRRVIENDCGTNSCFFSVLFLNTINAQRSTLVFIGCDVVSPNTRKCFFFFYVLFYTLKICFSKAFFIKRTALSECTD